MTRSIFQRGQLCSRSRLPFKAALAISAEAGKRLSTAYIRRPWMLEHSLRPRRTFGLLNMNSAKFGASVSLKGHLLGQIPSSWQYLQQRRLDCSRWRLGLVWRSRYKTWSPLKLRVSTSVSVDYHVHRRHSLSVWTRQCIFRSIRDRQGSDPSTQWLLTRRSIFRVALKLRHRKTVVKSKPT